MNLQPFSCACAHRFKISISLTGFSCRTLKVDVEGSRERVDTLCIGIRDIAWVFGKTACDASVGCDSETVTLRQ